MRTEFDNIVSDHPSMVDHLYKMQAARCNEFFIYLEAIESKYPTFKFGLSWWTCLPTRDSDSLQQSFGWLSDKVKQEKFIPLSEPERQKYFTKLQRVMDTKYNFELFQGEYKNYQ